MLLAVQSGRLNDPCSGVVDDCGRAFMMWFGLSRDNRW